MKAPVARQAFTTMAQKHGYRGRLTIEPWQIGGRRRHSASRGGFRQYSKFVRRQSHCRIAASAAS